MPVPVRREAGCVALREGGNGVRGMLHSVQGDGEEHGNDKGNRNGG
ncbi:hypothetical protein [Tunturibacter empetritectus]|uniref:Uncharacterized protein n=1 Tax=Tunturiibacter lichenicola TaxID=2051959 RepID=A0A7W8N4Q1_9BACT|nr:hypothetical protein [Edaphobacter lichenicola]MBB5345439.1 hypothetical protein [Edaphobacter lichenicola]